jgi:beta-glucuronidase
VWLNGELLGEHEGSFTQFRLDATPAVRFGDFNLLVVRIDDRVALDRLPPGLSLNRTAFDFLQYGGIHRPVYLELAERSYVDSLVVETDHEGALKAEARVANGGGLGVRFRLLDGRGGELLSEEVGCDGGSTCLDRRVGGVKPWSLEEPNLYTLRVELLGERGLLDMVEERVGFRSFKVEKGRIYLNGKPVYLKGFGRHEDFPITGKHVPGAALVRDFFLLKKLGASARCTCGTSPTSEPRRAPGRTVLNRKGLFTRDRRLKLAAHLIRDLFSSLPSRARSPGRG